MNRIDEKVKDIVEVRSHASLSNFVADSLQTLTGYHFTDITAELMAKWIGGVSRVESGGGAGFALAGFRGVGKSHFLATFGALLAHPEFRSRVSDSHVMSASQSLARKSYAVAFLRRGTQETLLAELKDGIAPLIGCEPASLSDSLNELLMRSAECAGALPLVLLIDTAFERPSRVTRDDGAVLAEIAETAKSLGVFVGIALDDDIAGADGVNSAISRTFAIDYLDQEHLYKIVDNHIFPKQARMRPVLHDIYEYYRNAVPNFRWSEERFRSLYPLHPSIMEIAPFVRLYMHEFALLGFASEAGSRILGRPANSLIAPDEVFDKAEKGLRQADELKEAFAAFDRINDVVVAKTPVMKRLQAKLILKGFFLFSLNDEGVTASEIGASMLIYDENDPESAIRNVEELLTAFAEAVPDRIKVVAAGDSARRYSFILDGTDDLRSVLAVAAANVPAGVAGGILKKLFEDRFSDCSFENVGDVSGVDSTDCTLEWRGGLRKGKAYWSPDGNDAQQLGTASHLDWTAVIQSSPENSAPVTLETDLPVVTWKAASLRNDELDTIRRYHVLMTDASIRTEYPDHIAASLQSHAVAADKIFQRTFLQDGVLSIDGFEYNFTDDARFALSLSQVFTIMLESLFEGRFPLHPYFPATIRMKDVSSLVADLYGAARPNLDEVQRMAGSLALPLGIVARPNNAYIPADAESLRELPLVVETLGVVKGNEDDVSSLDTIFQKLGAAPYGLVREAAYLLLAAMVSGRLIEFVTSNGDRINHRSLDLQLIWDDIVGVSSPADSVYSNERLLVWATLLTENSELRPLNTSEGRLGLLEAFQLWLSQWNEKRLAGRFDEVSDDLLNTRIWRLARTSIKAFRTAADSISAVLDNSLPIEGCLQRIADAFSDSEDEFARYRADLTTVEDFVAGAALFERIISWLSICEYTGNPEIDALRKDVYGALSRGFHEPSTLSNIDLGNQWAKFQKSYSEYFLDRHDALLATPILREKLDEILKTDLWWEFENLSEVPGLDSEYRKRANKIVQRLRQSDCRHDTKDILRIVPACGCSFTLGTSREIESLPEELWSTVNQGLISYRETIDARKGDVLHHLQHISEVEPDQSTKDTIAGLADYVSKGKEFRRLSDAEMRFVRRAFKAMAIERSELDRPAKPAPNKETLPQDAIPDFTDAVEEFEALLESMPS